MAMPAKKPPIAVGPEDDELVSFTFRIPRSLVAQLDAYTTEVNVGRGWPKLTRSDVIRGVLRWAVQAKPDWETR